MMARGIEAGDVVQVVRDCCGHYLGFVFTVANIEWVGLPQDVMCPKCRFTTSNLTMAYNRILLPVVCLPIGWLRRIEPPSEDVGEINKLWLPSPKREKVEAK